MSPVAQHGAHDLPFDIKVAGDLRRHSFSIPADTKNNHVFELFEADHSLANIPVVDKKHIVGLINRDTFMRSMARHFHWEVYSKKHCTKMMDDAPAIVDHKTPIRELAAQLLDVRKPYRLSEGFIITRHGELFGTGLTSDVVAAILILERIASESLQRQADQLAKMVTARTHDLVLARKNEERQQVENALAKTIIDRLSLRPRGADKLIESWTQPAEHFSGDTIAAARAPDGTLYALLADATGHGLSAAITVLPVLTLFYRLVKQNYPPEKIAHELNRELLDTMPTSRFVAAGLIALNHKTRAASIWLGGLPDVLHFDKDGTCKTRYQSHQVPLGIAEFAEDEEAGHDIVLHPGDQLLMVSDGLIEATNAKGESFGLERIVAAVADSRKHSPLTALKADFLAHMSSLPQHDDISALMIR